MCVGYNLYYNYHIAGDFREFHGFVAIRSTKFGGVTYFGAAQRAIHKSFLPRKFPTIRYLIPFAQERNFITPNLE